MKLKLVKKQPVAGNITTFWFEPESPVRYIAGQYIELFIPHPEPDNRREHRWFTLSSSPTESLLSITTRLNDKRKSSFKSTLSNLKIGQEIKMQLPMGDFVLPKDESLPLVFIAKGIGITPFRSMLKYLIDSDEKRNIKLIYSVNNAKDIVFKDIVKKSAKEFITHIGPLDAKKVLAYTGLVKQHVIYIAGPEKMVETLQNDLIKIGVSPAQIRSDFFHNYD